MKRNRRKIIFHFLLIFLFTGIFYHTHSKAAKKISPLSVKGTRIVNASGKTVQLKGVSTHGIAWYPQYVNKACFKSFKKMGANTIRLAFYSDDAAGYDKKLYSKIEDGVNAATDLGMYVVIDWHILSDGNPKTNQKKAMDFFTYFSKKYAGQNNILYEICNEPNGNVTWEKDIKPYAEKVIARIRQYDQSAIIIVGTPTWSQDVDVVAANPIKNYQNILYALHFYAATHKDWNRTKAKTALQKGLPILVSEFSICDASGNGRNDYKEARKWMNFLKRNKIGRIAWNISNKNESSALLKTSCQKTGKIRKKDLSKSGKWIIKNW